MRYRLTAALAVLAFAALVSIAVAAVTMKPGSVYFYVAHGHFSVTLKATSSKQIQAGNIAANVGTSGVLVVCPAATNGGISELLASFPGAKLKLSHGHYGFKLSYTEKHTRLNTVSGPNAGTHTTVSAQVKIAGTIASAKLIKGTISVTASGCTLSSSHYRAKGTKGL